jgi:hypothetical protein
VLCISVLLVAIDNTIVDVALPTLNQRINASELEQLRPVVRAEKPGLRPGDGQMARSVRK